MAEAWWKGQSGSYFNPDQVESVYPVQDGNDWKLNVGITDGGEWPLNGVWASAADAIEAARQLTKGFDPGTLNQ